MPCFAPHLSTAAIALTGLMLLPVTAQAETFQLKSRITAVTVYPEGAKVTRVADYNIPAGTHQLQVLDLPRDVLPEHVRAKLLGAKLGAVSLRNDFVPPVQRVEDATRAAAQDRVERAEEALARHQDEIRGLQLTQEAADTAIGFLRGLGDGEALEGAGAEELRQIARMMGEETLAARETVLQAQADIRRLSRDLPDLERAAKEARQALAALAPEPGEVMLVDVSAVADKAQQGRLEISYLVGSAGWQPVNDAFLDLSGAVLELERGALVAQYSGENWDGISLTLSTSQPSGRVAPSEVHADFRHLTDPARLRASAKVMSEAPAAGLMADMAAPEPVMEAEASVFSGGSQIQAGGLIISYRYPQPVSLAAGADAVKLSLGSLQFDAAIEAQAAPLYDQTAFLTAKFTNDSGEEILPSVNTLLYLDGELVGSTEQPMLAQGAEMRLPFGPIDGLQLSRDVERNQGDRGILSKSNERVENIRIEVENLTDRSWNMRLIDRVPYSEQEDLHITWSALPAPDEKDLENRRNVLAWKFEIAPGTSRQIKIDQRLSWPEEMVLR